MGSFSNGLSPSVIGDGRVLDKLARNAQDFPRIDIVAGAVHVWVVREKRVKRNASVGGDVPAAIIIRSDDMSSGAVLAGNTDAERLNEVQ